jgi:enoyl-CoA hydratase/carnithine racemase
MKGPIRLIRSGKISKYKNLRPIYEWSASKAYLFVDQINYAGKLGSILCYFNPPVHQVGNPGLDAYLAGLDKVFEKRDELEFLILYGSNDPVHAGADLKEILNRLDRTLETKKEEDIFFEWVDNRLKKGISLHAYLRKIAEHMRVVAVCGGGIRFGTSAEISLMCDYLVGDSRSAMCFSEALIGLIPGLSGIARALIKAGQINSEFMAKTSRVVKGDQLKEIGIYNLVVDIPFCLPKRQKTDDPDADKKKYQKDLELHNNNTGLLLLPKGFELSICPEEEIPKANEKERLILATKEEISLEVAKRKNPKNYSHLWERRLKDVKEDIIKLGRPLAPQSIDAINSLFEGYEPTEFDETKFVHREMEADARLYRDSRFRAGLIGTLEQRVVDFR